MQAIIEKAYKIFSKYKLIDELDVCTKCCMTIIEKSDLTNIPLREIKHELIYRHNTSASSNNPPIEEFKYFLPRYLELIYLNLFPSHSIELSLKRFDQYDKTEFEVDEVKLIEEFCCRYFEDVLKKYPCPADEKIDSTLVMLQKTKIDMNLILSIWSRDDSDTGKQHFRDLMEHCIDGARNKLSNPFSTIELDALIFNWIGDESMVQSKYN